MEISAQLEDVSSVKKRLHVEVPEAVATQEFARVSDEYKKHVRVPGFRKGKAPLGLIKRRFAGDIREEVIRKLVPDAYDQAIKDQQVHPLGEPALENLEAEEGKPLVFDAEFEVLPEIKLPTYKGLKAEVAKKEVSDEDVEARLEDLRKQFAQLVSVDDRPVQTGDRVMVDLKGDYLDEVEGKPSGVAVSEEGVAVEVGAEDTHKAFNENLVGMNIAEEKVFEVAYDDDYPEKKLAGRRVNFTVEVTDIKQEELPELNDEFAKDLGSFDSMDKVRETVRKDLETGAERERDSELHKSLTDQILEEVSFELPEILVRERLNDKLQDVARGIAGRGVDPVRANIDWRAMQDRLRPEAEREIRIQLLLDEVARAEEIEITSEDLDKEYDRIAQSTNQPVERVRQFFRDEERVNGVKSTLRRRRAMDIIVDSAEIS